MPMNKIRTTNTKAPKLKKLWSTMTSAQLEAESAQYDREFGAMRGARSLTLRDKAIHAEARRRAVKRRGRPQVGEGAAKVLVSIERGLLREVDAFAERNGFRRAELIAQGLKHVLGKAS